MAAGPAAPPQLFFEPKSFSHRYGDDYCTVTIPEWKIVGGAGAAKATKVSKGLHGAFVLEGRRGDKKWRVERRYSEFAKLHARGPPPPPPDAPPQVPPKLPPKTLWWTTQDGPFLERRRAALEGYLHGVLAVRGACALPHVWAFLSAGAVSAP